MKKRWKVQVPAVAMSMVLASGSMLPALAGQVPEVQNQKKLAGNYNQDSGTWKSLFELASPSDADKATASDAMKIVEKKTDSEYFIYASDLEWERAEVGWNSPWKDTAMDGEPLMLIDEDGELVTYEKGVFAHARSEIIYDIADKGITGFQSYVGVNYLEGKTEGSCTFEVWADDERLVRTEKIRRTDKQVEIDVEIPEGTQKIKLITTDAGDGNGNDHSIWADAKFLIDSEFAENLNLVKLDIDEIIIPVEGTAKAKAEAFLGDGTKVELDAEGVEVTFKSSDESVAQIDEEGNILGLDDGKVTITCTVTRDDVTKEDSADLVVGEGDDTTMFAKSPDGSQQVLFTMNQKGGVDFSAFKEGETIIKNSYTGIKTNLGDFSNGLEFVDKVTVEGIEDSYELIGAKTSFVENEYTEMTLNFTKEDVEYQIIARIYNDGFGFRYAIPSVDGEEGDELKIHSEATGFQLPGNTKSYVFQYLPEHEKPVDKKTNNDLTGTYAMPMLFETTEGTWGLLSEAALSPAYCGGSLNGRGNGLVEVNFAPEQKKDVVTTVPFESPWRFVVIGDVSDIHDNTMAENLSPACEFADDTSWIKPGVTGWTWLNRESTSDFETYKRYVDLASEMGWEYILLDEGWQPGGRGGNWITGNNDKGEEIHYREVYDWTEELIQYANGKGVDIIVWAYQGNFHTEERLRGLEKLADMGIKGIKIDFFDSQEQEMMILYDNLQQKTAEYKLLLNPHGANKTTGERRTYPQSLTREGIFGAEQHREPGRKAWLTAEYICYLPFTRFAVGPADFTPLMSYEWDLVNPNAYTISQMAAHTIVFESGIQCLADRPVTYLSSPAKSLLKNIPASWDESLLLDGIPGEYVNIARRNGDNWYVGIVCNNEREAEVDLSFLGDGTYYASIYKDGATNADIDVETMEVTSQDVLTIPIARTGGASVKILAEAPTQPDSITLSRETVTLEQHESIELQATLEPEGTDIEHVVWKSSNEKVATVNNGKITAIKPGTAEITASTGINNDISATCTVTVIWPPYVLDEIVWTLVNENRSNWKLNSENSLTIISDSGEYDTNAKDAKNVFYTDVTGDFSASVKLEFDPEANYQSAGFVIHTDGNAVIEVLRRYHKDQGGNIFATVNIYDGGFKDEVRIPDDHRGVPAYLKVTREGTKFTGFVSWDNEEWIPMGKSVINPKLAETDLKLGLYSVNGNGKGGEIPATFEEFTYEKDGVKKEIPFAIEVDQDLETLKADLEDLMDTCEEYDKADYTEDSFKALTDALEAVADALANKDVTKEDLSECYDNLQTAIDGLEKKEEVDKDLEKLKEDLKNLIDSCKAYDKDVYTESSYKTLTNALKAADDALANKDVTKAELSKCIKDLQTAIDGLEMKEELDKELEALKVKLANLVDSCKAYKEKDYTESSYKALTDAVNAANKALANKDVTKAELTTCYDNLQAAIKGLTKKPTTSGGSGGSGGSSGSSITTVTSGRWVQDATGWWYKNPDGSWPKAQWLSLKENGKTVWYYFGNDGYMRDGWLELNGKTYFLHNISDGTRGSMYTGWRLINEKWYYFEEKEGADQGRLYVNSTTPDGYQVDEYGVWVK